MFWSSVIVVVMHIKHVKEPCQCLVQRNPRVYCILLIYTFKSLKEIHKYCRILLDF